MDWRKKQNGPGEEIDEKKNDGMATGWRNNDEIMKNGWRD